MIGKILNLGWVGLAACWLGCAPTVERPPNYYYPKPLTPPAAVNCFDTVGHTEGAKPYLLYGTRVAPSSGKAAGASPSPPLRGRGEELGGHCFCTPTAAVLADYQKHGYFVGLTLDSLMAEYRKRGIKLRLDHQECNNMCSFGPHVIKGGQCMVPPTPGTQNYEELLTGRIVPLTKTPPSRNKSK